jgi:hypothetical protein
LERPIDPQSGRQGIEAGARQQQGKQVPTLQGVVHAAVDGRVEVDAH